MSHASCIDSTLNKYLQATFVFLHMFFFPLEVSVNTLFIQQIHWLITLLIIILTLQRLHDSLNKLHYCSAIKILCLRQKSFKTFVLELLSQSQLYTGVYRLEGCVINIEMGSGVFIAGVQTCSQGGYSQKETNTFTASISKSASESE